MNYKVKSISPLATLVNAFRVFIIVGFIVALISFFIYPNPNIRINGFWQKIAATLIFTGVYAVVVSAILTFIAWLYNFWAGKFKGISITLEQQQD